MEEIMEPASPGTEEPEDFERAERTACSPVPWYALSGMCEHSKECRVCLTFDAQIHETVNLIGQFADAIFQLVEDEEPSMVTRGVAGLAVAIGKLTGELDPETTSFSPEEAWAYLAPPPKPELVPSKPEPVPAA